MFFGADADPDADLAGIGQLRTSVDPYGFTVRRTSCYSSQYTGRFFGTWIEPIWTE